MAAVKIQINNTSLEYDDLILTHPDCLGVAIEYPPLSRRIFIKSKNPEIIVRTFRRAIHNWTDDIRIRGNPMLHCIGSGHDDSKFYLYFYVITGE